MYVYKDGVRPWRCTGTLVAPRVFLTAGHCVEDGVEKARVWFDSDMTDNPNYEGGLVGTPILHPGCFWGGSNPHDVGVAILDEAVMDIDPAPLPRPL
ncbi:MAG: trypsin-like serine protease [Anaerolineae bacterium]|nr:trypsin-like serine protease [Anaerolineae bacterium]